jgi:hypothetical protein
MSQFWQLLFALQHYTLGCLVVTQPVHAIVYGGNCLQAFALAVFSHGQWAMEWG